MATHDFGSWRINPETRELWRGDVLLPVPPRVFDCLVYLIGHRERAVGRDELISAVWGRVDVADVQVSQLIARTRRLLDDDAQAPVHIRTIPGFGYRWVAEPRSVEAEGQIPPSGPVEQPTSEPDEPMLTGPAPLAPADPKVQRLPTLPGSGSFGLRSTALLLAAALLAMLVALLWPPRAAVPDTAAVPEPAVVGAAIIAVLPFQTGSGAEDQAWLRLGAMDLVAHRLRRSGLPVPPSESVVAAGQGTADTPASAETVAGILGAERWVEGSIGPRGTGWRAELKVRGVGTPSIGVEASRADPVAAVRQASELLLIRLGRGGREVDHAGIDILDLDQRIKASLLAGDQAAARALLDAAPANLQSHARLRLRRAEFDYHAGRLDDSERQIDELLAEPGLEQTIRVRALLARGLLGLRRGDCAAAGPWLDRTLAVEASPGLSQELATALTARGMVRACLQQPAEAAADFGLARLRFEAQGDLLGVARVDNYLGLFEIDRHRPESALPHLLAALVTFDSFGVVDAQRAVNTALVQAHSLLLRWEPANAAATRLLDLRDQISDPAHRQLLDSDRSRVLLATGRLAEARSLIDAAEREAGGEGLAARHLRHSRALLAWQSSRWEELHEAAGAALAGWSRRGEADRAWLLWARNRAALAMQIPTEAVPDELRDQAAGVDAALALLSLADAVRFDQAGDVDAAERAYREALAHADTLSLAAVSVQVAGEYGRWLLGRQRLDEAEAMAGRIAVWAGHDYDAALLRLAVHHARGRHGAWQRSLGPLQDLAGEREVPETLLSAP